jgi:hypothetical protein
MLLLIASDYGPLCAGFRAGTSQMWKYTNKNRPFCQKADKANLCSESVEKMCTSSLTL